MEVWAWKNIFINACNNCKMHFDWNLQSYVAVMLADEFIHKN